MTTRYVGAGGNNSNAGTSWATRKLTLNGVEDTPVVAGDTVYVGAGTYREQLTCDVSGTAGSPITYIGDYDGSHTDGIGGVVRITGSDDDITATRANAIYSVRTYRTFTGFHTDLCTGNLISLDKNSDNVNLNNLFFGRSNQHGILLGAATNITVNNCYINTGFNNNYYGIYVYHGSGQSNSNNLIQNTIIENCQYGIMIVRVGGTTIKNCEIKGNIGGIRVLIALPAGQVDYVYNSIIYGHTYGLYATVEGELVEDYNSILGNTTARTNVAVGANSNTYPPLFDSRWFFELASKNQKLVSPFDLSSASQLINVAGTSPTTTDLRGQAVIGAQREWGALEYNPSLSIGGGISRGRIV